MAFQRVMGDKLRNDCFVNSITNNDFVLLTETWTRNNVQVSGYKRFISTPNVESINNNNNNNNKFFI